MEIQSAFNTGVQGFQKAQEDANQAAANIVKSTSVNAENFAVEQQNNAGQGNENLSGENLQSTETPNLTQSIVDLKVAELQAKASTEVIKTADDVLGNLLDVSV